MKPGRSKSMKCGCGIALAALAALTATGCRTGVGGLGRQFEWVESHPGAPTQIKKTVLGKKLIEGMSEDAVLASWGRPNEKTDLGAGDSRWKYRKHQATKYGRRTIEYTLIFGGGVVVRILTEQCR